MARSGKKSLDKLIKKYGLYLDDKGIYRSKPLPRIRGPELNLSPKIDDPQYENQWTENIRDSSQLIVLDLFCGAGGFSSGFQSAGFFVAAGVDNDSSSNLTHGYNFLSKSVCTDITDIADPRAFLESLNIPRVDVIIGGPPCQGFSNIGKGIIKKLGLEDYYHNILNNLYQEFVRFVEILQPKAFIMENVPAMGNFQEGELVERIVEEFIDIGYSNTSSTILNAMFHGVPQSRDRLFIGGTRFESNFQWPTQNRGSHEILTVCDAISDLPVCSGPIRENEMPYNNRPQSEYQNLMRSEMTENIVYDHIIRDVRRDDQLIFSIMKEGDKYIDIPEQLRRYKSDSFKDKYSKLIWNEPSWTVTAHISKDAYRYIHPDPKQGRMLSVREFARLQSFPDHFRFCGSPTQRLKQIGNAVPPLLAESIAKNLYEILSTETP